MQRRCAACNAINRDDVVYCEKCGRFLLAGSANEQYRAPRSIWESGVSGDHPAAGAGAGAAVPSTLDSWSAICPDCGKKLTGRGTRPVFCPDCNSILSPSDFAAADRHSDSGTGAQTKTSQIHTPENSGQRQNGPLHRRRQNDRSSLRLIGSDSAYGLVMPVQESGATFGSDVIAATAALKGRCFQGLEAKQLFFWHTDSGWYARALAGITIQNGDRMDIGASRPVLDGDTFQAGQCTFRAEVIQSRG